MQKTPHIGNMSIIVTPTAYNRIEEIRAKKGDNDLYLRIAVSGGGCSGFKYDLSFDTQVSENDNILDDVVVIDPDSAPLLQGAILDYEVTMMGENFKIKNPNATSGCGCGESFAV